MHIKHTYQLVTSSNEWILRRLNHSNVWHMSLRRSHVRCHMTISKWHSDIQVNRGYIRWIVASQFDPWQIHLLFFCFFVLRSAGRLRRCLISYVPRNPWGKFCPHQSAVFNTLDVGYLGPKSGKTRRKRGLIRATDGMGPCPRYTTSELETDDCTSTFSSHSIP